MVSIKWITWSEYTWSEYTLQMVRNQLNNTVRIHNTHGQNQLDSIRIHITNDPNQLDNMCSEYTIHMVRINEITCAVNTQYTWSESTR